MKRSKIVFLLWKKIILLTFIIPIISYAGTQAPVLSIQHWQTANKVNVYYVYVPQLPIVDIDVIFRAGSAYDDKNQGIANLTANMIGQGAQHLTANDIADQFDNVGAIFESNVTKESVTFHLRSLTNKNLLSPALQTFTTILTEPNFGGKSFNRVKAQTLQALLQDEQTPSNIATKAFFNALYGNQPYAHSILGKKETIQKLTPEMLLSFYKRYYVSSNATVIIVGQLQRPQAEILAKHLTQKLPQGSPATTIPLPTNITHNEQIHIPYPASQTNIRIGEMGIDRHNPDYFPLIVGNYIFGGGVLSSRLFKEIRVAHGLTYDISSAFIPFSQKGAFIISLQTKTDKTKEAITLVNEALKKFIAQGPSQEELNLAKQNMIGSFPLHLDSNNAILSEVSTIALYQLPLNYLDTYRQNINRVTVDEIKIAFKQYIDPEKLVTITVGNQS